MAVTRLMKVKAANTICKFMTDNRFLRDPISLEMIREKYVLIRHCCKHYYDARTLFDYILSSGDFLDPVTRMEYDSCELLRLEHILQIQPHTLSKQKTQLLDMRRQYFTVMGLCDVFEIEIMDQVVIIRDEIEHENFDIKLRIEIIPLIIQSFENFRSIHKERCSLALKSILHKLKEEPIALFDVQLRMCHVFEVLLYHCTYDSTADS